MQHIKFSRSQTSKRPGEAKQKNAANQQKMACSGAFGTPGWVRTSGLSLRRRPLYPTELRGRIQKIFNFQAQPDSNELPLRRRTLYPGEVRGHIQKLFSYTRLRDSNGSIVRRAVLCPAELLAHMQFLFVSVTPAVENPPDVRRRLLYPTELQRHLRMNPRLFRETLGLLYSFCPLLSNVKEGPPLFSGEPSFPY